jgi:hypothetical protein
MLRRRRPLLRAAAVGGAAYYAGQRANARNQAEAEQDERLAGLEAPPGSPLTAQLQELAALRDQGVLTDAEFTAAKARLLGPGGADPR